VKALIVVFMMPQYSLLVPDIVFAMLIVVTIVNFRIHRCSSDDYFLITTTVYAKHATTQVDSEEQEEQGNL
jgi:hypothetical protein